MNKIKLFAFPYAGGNSNIFRPWKRQLDKSIELVPVELAGRGARMLEPLFESIDDTVNDLGNLFEQNKSDYALFGHSMGSIIIFELLNLIYERKVKPPIHVFFSGRQAPHVKKKDEKKYHLMDEYQFRKEIIELGGTSEEIFDDPELAGLFLPVLKNDFMICENYLPKTVSRKFTLNFSVLTGIDEGYSEDELNAYREYTTGETTIKYFPGGHFFIKESEMEVIDFINKTLLNYLQ